jgi:hypothetical protein
MTNQPNSSDDDERVVSFRSGRPVAKPPAAPVEDLAKYHGTESEEEYRHRMIVNIAALAFIVALVAAGWWLAGAMVEMRKNEDCVVSGRRDCVPIEYYKQRW